MEIFLKLKEYGARLVTLDSGPEGPQGAFYHITWVYHTD